MKQKRIVIGAAILAAGALGGLWLFQQIPVTRGALQQACVKAHDRSLVAAYIRLPEGMTAEEYEEMVLANCDCVARKALRQLPLEELVPLGRNPLAPENYSKIQSLMRQCGTETS